CDGKGTDQTLGIWPDRLQNDAADAFLGQPFENGSNALGCIGYTKRFAGWGKADVEKALADIDAGRECKILRCHGIRPVYGQPTGALATVRSDKQSGDAHA